MTKRARGRVIRKPFAMRQWLETNSFLERVERYRHNLKNEIPLNRHDLESFLSSCVQLMGERNDITDYAKALAKRK